MFAKGNRAKTIATIGIASVLVFGAGSTAIASRAVSLSSTALTSTVSAESVKSADQKLGLNGSSSKDGSAKQGPDKGKGEGSGKTVSSKSLATTTARELPKYSVSEADALEKSGKGLDEKLEEGKTVDAAEYLDTHGKARWKTATASTYGTGDGLMGSACSDGSKVTETSMGVAHKTLKLGTKIQLIYGDKVVEATVHDRGPYVEGREIDLQPAVSRALGFSGVGTVEYRVVD